MRLLILTMQLAFCAIGVINAQSTIMQYTTVSLDSKELNPVLERAQKELSPREILIVVITSSKDTTASHLYLSSITSTAELEENIPSFIGRFSDYPVLVYLRNMPVYMPHDKWMEVKKALRDKLSVHTLEQFRMGVNYDPEVRLLTLKQDRVIQQRQSIDIVLPGWKY